jgi:hypothetical protein
MFLRRRQSMALCRTAAVIHTRTIMRNTIGRPTFKHYQQRISDRVNQRGEDVACFPCERQRQRPAVSCPFTAMTRIL